jgi:hypothetical protein
MRIEFTINRSAAYFRSLRRPDALRAIRSMVLGAGVCIVVGVVSFVAAQAEGVGAVLGFILAIVGGMSLVRARKVYALLVTAPAGWSLLRQYMVTGDALESSTEGTSVRWTWAAVNHVEERPEAYLFWQAGPVMFDLPRSALTATEDAELRAFLAGRGLSVAAGGR